MKKQIYTAIVLMILFPLTASANLIGSGVLKVDSSTSTAGSYGTKYDENIYTYTAGKIIDFTSNEFFYVDNESHISPASFHANTSNGVGIASNELSGTWPAHYQNAYINENAYINDRLLAVSYSDKGKIDGQKYHAKAAPGAEPATMLLCGTCLVSLASVVRRRKKSAVNSPSLNEYSPSPLLLPNIPTPRNGSLA